MNLEIVSNTARDRDRGAGTGTARPLPGLRQPPREPTESELALLTARRRLTDAQLQIARLADRNRLLRQRLQSLARAETLHEAAKRVIACIAACRYGDDEFIVMPSETDAQDYCAEAERGIRARLAGPGVINGITVTLTLTIGSAGPPVDAKDWSETVKLADIVMHRERAGGKAHIRWAGRTSI